jgi:hypothetical protein
MMTLNTLNEHEFLVANRNFYEPLWRDARLIQDKIIKTMSRKEADKLLRTPSISESDIKAVATMSCRYL